MSIQKIEFPVIVVVIGDEVLLGLPPGEGRRVVTRTKSRGSELGILAEWLQKKTLGMKNFPEQLSDTKWQPRYPTMVLSLMLFKYEPMDDPDYPYCGIEFMDLARFHEITTIPMRVLQELLFKGGFP